MENQIQHLVKDILKLSDKIENLENKIEVLIHDRSITKQRCISEFPEAPPRLFLEWIESFIVSIETLEIICQQPILEGFKHCLNDNFKRQLLPLFVKGRPRQLYVFTLHDNISGRSDIRKLSKTNSESDEATVGIWQPFTDDHLDQLIQEIWRKILQKFLDDTEMFAEEDERTQNYRDICMKKIMEMRKILASRHRKEIIRCLMASSRDKNIL